MPKETASPPPAVFSLSSSGPGSGITSSTTKPDNNLFVSETAFGNPAKPQISKDSIMSLYQQPTNIPKPLVINTIPNYGMPYGQQTNLPYGQTGLVTNPGLNTMNYGMVPGMMYPTAGYPTMQMGYPVILNGGYGVGTNLNGYNPNTGTGINNNRTGLNLYQQGNSARVFM